MTRFSLLSHRTLVLLCFLLASCVSNGVAEFQLYDQAFDAQYEQGGKVLDRLASAERVVVVRQLGRDAVPSFNPDNAGYYVTVGDPPLTAAIRTTLKSVRAYNKALSALGSGEASAALSARLGTISSNLSAAAGALAIATGGSGAFAIAGLATVNRLLPIFTRANAIDDRAQFRRRMLEAYPDMRQLILEMRSGTKEMFEMMRRSYVSRGKLKTAQGISTENQAQLDQDRTLLAAWVLLLDQSLLALDSAHKSALSQTSESQIKALSDSSVELRVFAETIKAAEKAN